MKFSPVRAERNNILQIPNENQQILNQTGLLFLYVQRVIANSWLLIGALARLDSKKHP